MWWVDRNPIVADAKEQTDTLFHPKKCVFLHFRAARREAGIANGVAICSPNCISAFSWKPGTRSSRVREFRIRDSSGCRFLAHARSEFRVSTKTRKCNVSNEYVVHLRFPHPVAPPESAETHTILGSEVCKMGF